MAPHQALARALVATATVRDATKLYWYLRLLERFETVEFCEGVGPTLFCELFLELIVHKERGNVKFCSVLC